MKPDGALANGRKFFDMSNDTGEGVPDGMKIDRAGNIFATGPGGVLILSPQGKHLGTIEPPEIPANCAWGDGDAKTLYITARTSLYRVKLTAAGSSWILAHSGSGCFRQTEAAGRCGNSTCSICCSSQVSGNGHLRPAASAADKYSWTVLWRNGTTAGDLMLAESEGMEPQKFLQLTHGQPLLWQLESRLLVKSSRHGCPTPLFQSDADHHSELQP
jgi:hypothetical protein